MEDSTMDALTDILRTVQLQGSVYCRSELTAPWGIAVPDSDTAQFHVVRRGRCWLRLGGPDARPADGALAPVALEAGDVALLPRGLAHVLADAPETPAEPLADLIACHLPAEGDGPLVHGGGGAAVTLICGYFRFTHGAVHPLLSVLPPVVIVRGEAGRARSWLESTLDLIAEESTAGRPGGETLIDRLTEAVFVHVLRSHLEEQVPDAPSWLAGLGDPQIARALGYLHRQPGERWTVEDLALRVGMSRSAFASRFRDLVGEPPLAYLTRWRMQLAATRLREARLSLPEIAAEVGYQAEASFSKVFKRLWGVAPAAYRRQASASPAGASAASLAG